MDKKIYPDYDLQYDGAGIGIITYIRKQNSIGVWHLIPVIERWYFKTGEKIDLNEEVLECLKNFHVKCYKIVLFYRVQDVPLITIHGRTLEEIDPNQEPELDRLCPYINKSREVIKTEYPMTKEEAYE